jgi:hypothetical protein
MLFSGAWGRMIHEKPEAKHLVTCSFKTLYQLWWWSCLAWYIFEYIQFILRRMSKPCTRWESVYNQVRYDEKSLSGKQRLYQAPGAAKGNATLPARAWFDPVIKNP